jgi:group I intron endonuclease
MGKHKKIAGIYAITCIVDKKMYIGYSVNIKNRWDSHKCKLRKDLHTTPHLQSAWNKYGERMFAFSILEELSWYLTKQEYELIETKWVLQFNTHKSKFGYNSVLPGTIPLYREDENITAKDRKLVEYVCINILNNEVIEIIGSREVMQITNIRENKINDLVSYWEGKGKRKSLNGWIIMRKDMYNADFDYVGYKKIRTDYSMPKLIRKPKKIERVLPENIIPYSERKLKRVSIIAHNIETGEETIYPMFKSCGKDFNLIKVRKCINAPFGKYKHRGHYFRKEQLWGLF